MDLNDEEQAQYQAWLEHAATDMMPKMDAAAFTLTVYTGGFDATLAVETGAAVLLDKPIILLVAPGTKVPRKLSKIADRIVETGADGQVTEDTMRRVISAAGEMGLQDE